MAKVNSGKKMKLAVISACLLGGGGTSPAILAEEGGALSLLQAVSMALELSPNRFIQQAEVTAAQAGVTIQEGAFNPTPSAGVNVGQNYLPMNHVMHDALYGVYTPPFLDAKKHYQGTDTAVAHAELSKYFQSGMTASVEVVDTRTAQRNLTTDSRPNANTSQVNLRLNIPLLKYSGEVSASGYLNSARKQQEAAIEDYKFFLTTLVRDTVAAYWDYRLATESAQIREKSRDRVMRITDQVDLFTSSPNPAKEKLLKEQLAQVIYTATGARANRSQALIAAQQQAEQARTNLAMMLGVPPEQFTTLSQAGDEIPKAIIPKEFDVKKYQASWRKTAMENRLDLRAANLRQDAVKIMVNKAERDLYPQVDLNLSAGYQGLSEGNKIDNMWNALNDNVPGPNWSAGLEFRYPIGNQAAEGTLDSSRARLQQAGLAVYQTIRGIHAGVDIDAGYVERYVKAISKAEQAVAEYTEALAAWKRKPLTDPSSILGMLQTESQLTESYINMLAIRAAYAQTVADIRQKTGLLGSTGNTIEDYSISYSDVTMLPGIN